MAMFKAQDAMSMAQEHMSIQEQILASLHRLEDSMGTSTMQLAVAEIGVEPGLQKDFPVAGSQRQIINRLATGGLFTFAAATPTDILKANVNRLGGSIVNWGETTVIITLATAATDVAQEGLAEIVLSPKGGSWDFRLGNLMWAGSVSAESIGGEGKLGVAEV